MNANGSGRKERRRWRLAGGEPGRLVGGDHPVRQGRPVRDRDDEAERHGAEGRRQRNQQQSAGGPDYAPTGHRLAWYRVTYNKSGQGFAASDLFVRNGTHNTNITRRSSAKFFSRGVGAERKNTRRDPRAADDRLDEAERHRDARADLGLRAAHTGIASAVYSPDGTKIAYLQCTGDCGDPQLQGQGSIWVMNANGSGKQRIFNGDDRPSRPTGCPGASPSYSGRAANRCRARSPAFAASTSRSFGGAEVTSERAAGSTPQRPPRQRARRLPRSPSTAS